MKHEHYIDVSRNWPDPSECIPAFLVLKSDSPKARESKGALALFKAALSGWLAETEEGKAAWQSSSEDFNYGDFLTYDVGADKDFLNLLHKNGIASAEVITGVQVGDERYDTITEPAECDEE